MNLKDPENNTKPKVFERKPGPVKCFVTPVKRFVAPIRRFVAVVRHFVVPVRRFVVPVRSFVTPVRRFVTHTGVQTRMSRTRLTQPPVWTSVVLAFTHTVTRF